MTTVAGLQDEDDTRRRLLRMGLSLHNATSARFFSSSRLYRRGRWRRTVQLTERHCLRRLQPIELVVPGPQLVAFHHVESVDVPAREGMRGMREM